MTIEYKAVYSDHEAVKVSCVECGDYLQDPDYALYYADHIGPDSLDDAQFWAEVHERDYKRRHEIVIYTFSPAYAKPGSTE